MIDSVIHQKLMKASESHPKKKIRRRKEEEDPTLTQNANSFMQQTSFKSRNERLNLFSGS